MYSFLDPSRAQDFAMDPEQMLNLAETFESSLSQDLKALGEALDNPEPDPMHRLLHALKGYVTFLSKDELSAQVIHLESMSRQSPVDDLRNAVHAVLPSLQTLLAEVIRWKSTELQKQD